MCSLLPCQMQKAPIILDVNEKNRTTMAQERTPGEHQAAFNIEQAAQCSNTHIDSSPSQMEVYLTRLIE